MLEKLHHSLHRQVSIAPLAGFRIVFGLLLFFSSFRTLQKGWVYELYVLPNYHFAFFDWIKPLDASGMTLLFILLCVSALGITLGFFYRLSALVFFILFTYVELIDKTYYLNHYYLVSLLCFWLVLVPANRSHSLDALLFPKLRSTSVPHWSILIFKVQLSIVYFYAGLAKVNPDWLFEAQPLASWLPGRYDLPLLGSIMHWQETAYLFSWAGCIYDLSIWIFLWRSKTRGLAYFFVLVFHILTAIIFPRIGMFPYIMITATLVFFSAAWHQKWLRFLPFKSGKEVSTSKETGKKSWLSLALGVYLMIQLYLPLRYLQYDGNLFWHELGYRFSWRVMLMEKNGFSSIILKDPKSGEQKEIDQKKYLTAFQRQQMRSQPDMLFQFAKHIGDEFLADKGYAPKVYIKSRISLNGRRSQPFTDESIDVYALEKKQAMRFILPLQES
ncbi:MAG: HTTM domain-containing protein [Vicingaceae bacterium]